MREKDTSGQNPAQAENEWWAYSITEKETWVGIYPDVAAARKAALEDENFGDPERFYIGKVRRFTFKDNVDFFSSVHPSLESAIEERGAYCSISEQMLAFIEGAHRNMSLFTSLNNAISKCVEDWLDDAGIERRFGEVDSEEIITIEANPQ